MASIAAGSALAFASYAAAVVILWRRPPTRRLLLIVIGVGITLLVAGVLALPNTSTDIFDYLLTARVRTAHGANPLLTAPDAFRQDPLWPFATHQYTARPDNKLGIWVLFSLPIALVGGGDPIRSLLVMRAALGLISLINIVLLWRALRRVAPNHVCAGTAMYAWNPIVAIHSSEKTDTLMVAFFLGSVLLSLYGRERWATVAATASTLVKLLSAPFAAVLVVGQVRRSRNSVRELTLRAALVITATLVAYQAFGHGPLLILRQMVRANSPGWNVSPVVSAIVILGFAGLTVLTASLQDGTIRTYVSSSLPMAIYAAASLSYVGYSWYLFIPLALVSLARDVRAVVALVLISTIHAIRNEVQDASTGGFHVALPHIIGDALVALLGLMALFAYISAIYALSCAPSTTVAFMVGVRGSGSGSVWRVVGAGGARLIG